MRGWKVAAATLGLSMALGGTALAAGSGNSGQYSTSFVDGAGVLTDDFGDHYSELGGSLCNGCANSWGTDTVLMWQAILVAEGFLGHGDLDGKFGPGTASATRKWQSRYGLTADGRVGPNTWGRADNNLRWQDSYIAVYVGREGKVKFNRGDAWAGYDSGAYDLVMVDANGDITPFNSWRIQHKKRTVGIS